MYNLTETFHNLTETCHNLTRTCHNLTETCHNLTRNWHNLIRICHDLTASLGSLLQRRFNLYFFAGTAHPSTVCWADRQVLHNLNPELSQFNPDFNPGYFSPFWIDSDVAEAFADQLVGLVYLQVTLLKATVYPKSVTNQPSFPQTQEGTGQYELKFRDVSTADGSAVDEYH